MVVFGGSTGDAPRSSSNDEPDGSGGNHDGNDDDEIRFEGLDDLWCMEIGPPFPPGPLSVMRVEDNSIHVQWTDRRRLRLPSERSFRLLIREKHNALQQDAADRGNPWCTAYEGPDMSFVIKEYLSTPAMTTTVQQKVRIQPLTEYEVRVLAVNFAGDSSFWDDKNYSDHVEDGGRLSWRRSSDSSSPVCIRTTGPSISPRDVKARRLPISSVRATSGNGWVPDSPSAESVEVVEESCVLMEWLPHEMPNHKTASTDGIMVHKYVIEVCCTLVASTSADDAELGSRYGQREQPMSEDGLEARVRKKARVDPAGDLPAAQAGRRNESEKLQPQNPQQRANGKIPSTQNGNASPPSQMTVDSPKVVTVNERVDNRGESVTQRRAIISTGWRHFRELNARGPLDENGSRQAISMVLPIRDLTENVVRPAYAQHFSSSPQGSIPEVDRDENKAPLPNGLGPRTLKRKRGPTPQSGSVEASTTNTDERFDSSSQHQHHHPSWPPLENVEVELRFQVVGETRTGYRSEPAKATYYEDLEATSPSPLRSPAPVPMATRTLDCIKFVISAPEPTSLATYPHKVPFTPHGYKVLSALLDQVPQMQTTSTASTATTSQTHIDDTSELCNVEGPRVNQEITSMSSSDLSLPDTLDATCGGREEAGVQNDKILTLCEDGDDLRAEGKGSALSKSRLASNRDMNHLDSGVSTENVPFRAMVQKQAGDENVGVLDLHDVGPQTLSASTTSDRAAPALQTPQEGAESTTDQLLEDGTSSTTCPESLQQNTTDHTNQEQERHLADRREEQGNSLMSSVPSTAVVHISSAGDLGIPSCPTSPPSSHVTNEDLSIGEEFRFMDSAAGGVLFPEEEESAVLVESLHMQLPQPLLDTTSVNADLNEAASIIETLTSPPHLSNSAKPPVTSTGGKLELAADKISSSAEVDEPIEMEVDVEKAGAKRGLVSDSGTPLDGSKMSDSGKETQQQNAGALAMDMDVKIGARDGLGKCVSASHTGVGRPTVSDEVAMEIETKEHDQAPELNPLAATAGAVSTTGVSADQMQVDVEGDGANGGTIERSDRIEEEVWGDKSTETSKPEIPLVFVSEEKKTAGTQSKSDLSNGDIVQQQHEKRSMPIEAGLPTPATNLSEDSLPLLVNATTPPGTNIATRTISTKTKSIDGRTKPSPSISPPMDNISLSASLPVNDKSDGSISSPLPSAPLDTTKPPPGTPVRGDDKDSATTSTTPEKTGTLPPHPPTWHFNFRYGDFLRARWVRELEAGTSDAGKGGKGGKGVKVDKAGKVANVGPSGQDNSHEFYLARVLHYIVGLDDSIKLKVHWVGFQGAQSKAVIDLTPPATDCRHRGEQLTEAAEEEWRKYLDTRLRKDETTTRTKYDEQALQIDKFDRKPKRVSQELKDQVERGEVPIVLESTSSSRSSTPTVAQTKTKGKSAKGGKTAAPQKKGRKSLG
ncbi:hypothetical protein HK102_012935 [Quaeritorhiza haematococci]|nr:hypothetical protein HK102_012935 [Quaeritorhiza haematococci]